MTTANPAVITIIQDLNYGFFRQLNCQGTSAPWQDAVDDLAPTTGYMGACGKPSDNESTFRGMVDALAASPRSKYCAALLGVNEPNDADTSWGSTSVTNTLKQLYWVWDEANSVVWSHRGGSSAGENRPPIFGPALKRNGSGAWDPDGHRYDDDLAKMAAATYNPGSGAISVADVIDGLDHHQYDGNNSPGSRVDGRDSYGNRPPSLTIGSDGKCSRVDLEIALAQQIAPSKPVKARSEFGWEDNGGNAQHALYGQETLLRCYRRGVMAAIYETIDEGPSNPNGSGNWFGLTNLTNGPKQIYGKLKTLWNYTGSAAFTGVGWIEPLSGVNPDCETVVFSKAAGGWDWYILSEAETTINVAVSKGHSLVGGSVDHRDAWGNKFYHVNLASTMTLLQVV